MNKRVCKEKKCHQLLPCDWEYNICKGHLEAYEELCREEQQVAKQEYICGYCDSIGTCYGGCKAIEEEREIERKINCLYNWQATF